MRTIHASMAAALLALAAASALGAEPEAQPAAGARGWAASAWDHLRDVYREGSGDLYLSGYAHHGRGTYDDANLADISETAWGGGLGRSITDAQGRLDAVYAMAIRDSNRDLQLMAGYARLWRWRIAGDLHAGVGGTALLISRAEYFSRAPFPAVLPLAGVDYRNVAVMAAYVPPSPGGKRNVGDVLYVFARVSLGR